MLVTREVSIELRALPQFWSKLQLDKLFDRFQASVGGVVSWIYVKFFVYVGLADGQVTNLRPLVHCHDLSAFSCCRVRHGRLLDGRI